MKIVDCSVVLRKVDGTDLDVVNAARVSFHKESKELDERDAKLINYLAKHNHWTPFGHVGATFVIKAPIFVARQLVKHQVGLVWNEVSRRYVDEEPEFWFPKEWRGRPVNAKQGSSGVVDPNEWDALPEKAVGEALICYNDLLRSGVAPEQARMVLPQNTMTEWWWSGSLAAWTRVCKLRLDPHAQQETRDVVQLMANELTNVFPVSFKALMEN
jgi:thymidylate synthase (FAD)